MAVWRWIVAPDYEGDTMEDGFEPIQTMDNSQGAPGAER